MGVPPVKSVRGNSESGAEGSVFRFRGRRARGEPHEGRGRSECFTADDNVFELNRSASEICSLARTLRMAHHPKGTIRQEESEK